MRERTGAVTRGACAVALAAVLATAGVAAAQEDRRAEDIYDRSFDVSPGGELVVDVGDMDLRIETGDSPRVTVTAWARDLAFARDVFERMRFSATVSGNTLRVETREERGEREWREWERRGGAGFDAVITIPADFQLDIDTGDGDVLVGSTVGRAAIRTGDGDVSIRSIRGSRITIRTGDGDLEAGSLDADEVELRTGDGDISVDEVSGTVRASSGDGDVSVGIGRFAGLTVDTGDGDVHVYADPSIRATLDVSGEDLELGSAFTLSGRLRKHRLTGTLNGGGPALEIRTGDGSISIDSR